MVELGNLCTVVKYPGRKHGFYNLNNTKERIEDYYSVLSQLVNFLNEREILEI